MHYQDDLPATFNPKATTRHTLDLTGRKVQFLIQDESKSCEEASDIDYGNNGIKEPDASDKAMIAAAVWRKGKLGLVRSVWLNFLQSVAEISRAAKLQKSEATNCIGQSVPDDSERVTS